MKKVLLFLVCCFISCNVLAGFYEGVAAERQGNYNKAIHEYLPLAEAGEIPAQINLAYIYVHHVKNCEKALVWLKKAAKQNSAVAYNNLGFLYSSGICVYKNNKVAFGCYGKGAYLGNVNSQENLAAIYLQGIAVKSNIKLGLRLMLTAAKSGSPEALYSIGMFYEKGRYLKKNINAAISYYEKAVKAGYIYAATKLAFIYELGQGGTPKNYQKAYHWFSLAAQHGNKEAQNALKILKQKMKAEGITPALWKKEAQEKAKKAEEEEQKQQKQNQEFLGNPKTK